MDFVRREGRYGDQGSNEVVIMLTLERLNGQVRNSQGSLNKPKEFSDLRDPEYTSR